MNNNQLYPFERNRYYSGKMLTSADFQAEQNYFNNKRRFFNNLCFGSGIISGLSVFGIDDSSVLIESGVAIDGMGREIVVDTSVVKKLSALEGYDSLETEYARLCLRYQEQEIHSVFAVGNRESGKEYEYNRIAENYAFFLEDVPREKAPERVGSGFLYAELLAETDDFRVELVVPNTVCPEAGVKVKIVVTKLSEEERYLSYQTTIQTPAFQTPDGAHEFDVNLSNIFLGKNEVFTKEYMLVVKDAKINETNLVIKSGSNRGTVDSVPIETVGGVSLKIKISGMDPYALVEREVGRASLESMSIGSGADYIVLAELSLVRTDTTYIISGIIEDGVKKYVSVPSHEKKYIEYINYFFGGNGSSELSGVAEKTSGDEFTGEYASRIPDITTGTLEIPLGDKNSKGNIYYSGEILHGLGRGNVYVDVGYEYIKDDKSLGGIARNTIYGATDLFKDDIEQEVDMDVAVKVMNDKGSFMVAARLNQKVDFLILTFRWVAVKFPSGDGLGILEDYSGKSIAAVTPTVVLECRESHFFQVRYNNMDPESISYELTESGSGEITPEGVYTAPSKEGVYEIHIYCTDMPIISTYAYAIVRKNLDVEEKEQ